MTYDSESLSAKLSVVHVMSMCGLFTLPAAQRLLSTVFWGGFEKLSSSLLLVVDLLCSPGWGFRIS